MSSVSHRIRLMTAFTFTVLLSFGYLTYHSLQNYQLTQSQLTESYLIVESSRKLNENQENKNIQELLSKLQNQLLPQIRQQALRDFLKSPGDREMQFLIRTEEEFRNYIKPLIEYFEKRTLYFGGISLGVAALLSLGLTLLTLGMIFRPIQSLSKQMIDFLNNRYSYKFTVPATNEIGQLHSNFNSMAQKVLQQIEELQTLDKAKTEFLSIASHELRTPLTSIKGSLSLLNSGVAGSINESTKKLMTIALTETDRLIRIINELLDLAKIEARQFPINPEWVPAQDMIQRTFSGLDGLCSSANVKLSSEGEDDVAIYVDVDRTQQVLTNLLSNAIKFSPPESTVSVKIHTLENGFIRFDIKDQGPGIAPEEQELIFEKFRQATSDKNPLVKGTGLGLAIAKALVEQHEGTIGVTSKPGEGSTFYFTLPKWRPYSKERPMVAS